jgi:hypothetical protein
MDHFWMHEDTNDGYYIGLVNLEKAVFVKEMMSKVFKENLPGWTISYVMDADELVKCMGPYTWREND